MIAMFCVWYTLVTISHLKATRLTGIVLFGSGI